MPPRSIGLAVVAALALAVVGCGSAADTGAGASVPTATTEAAGSAGSNRAVPHRGRGEDGSYMGKTLTGTWDVGDRPGLIPPGQYRVSLTGHDAVAGLWVRCRAKPCGPGYKDNLIDTGHYTFANFDQGEDVVMVVEPTDKAVYLSGVSLTPVR